MLKPVEDPRFTYADYLRWSDTGRLELLAGRVVYPDGPPGPRGMSPAPSRSHQRLVLRLQTEIRREDGARAIAETLAQLAHHW